ncbi:MAG TPA: DUF2062 domain-containing protein [Geomobilimonas sp.]|nr:DUF2062 domain-containing protein [Geomobilimonas sp.]
MLDKEKWKKRFKDILSLDSHPGHIAAGFAVGVFISFTPFFGMHTPMAIVAAFIFRLNKVTCITGAWVNTPLTVAPALIGSYKLGGLLLGRAHQDLVVKELTWDFAVELMRDHGAPLVLGSSVIGFAAAVAAYFVLYYLVVRFRQKDETLDELTKEMEETGEELEE